MPGALQIRSGQSAGGAQDATGHQLKAAGSGMKPGSTLIVSFDGLRRDRATPELMPNLAGFMAEGTNFVNSRSVFPSETRVAVTSTATGCWPAMHGLVANQFLHPVVPDRLFNTASAADLTAAAEAGQLIDVPSIGARLAAAGKVMAVVSTATPGATRMMHPDAAKFGHPVYSVHLPPVSTKAEWEEAERILGSVPEFKTPNGARLNYAVDMLTKLCWPRHDPDLCLMWFNDPDMTSHGFGTHSPETAEAQRQADLAFGRVVEWWKSGKGPENLMVMSDHGQITGLREVKLAELLPQWRGRVSPGALTGIWLREDESLEEAVQWLSQQWFTGLIFADGVEGALPWALTGNGHPRGMTLGFSLRADLPGAKVDGCLFPGNVPVGGGYHGGPHLREVSTVLAGAGPGFRKAHVSEVPCWLPDIGPTALHLLGVSQEGCGGRALVEGLAGDAPAPEVIRQTHSRHLPGYEAHLATFTVAGRTFIDHGWSRSDRDWI